MRYINIIHFLVITFLFIGCQNKIEKAKVARDLSKIIFLSNRDLPKRTFNIYKMNPDGSEQKNLTPGINSIRSTSHPVLSPDGKNIVFRNYKESSWLMLLNIDNPQFKELSELSYINPQAQFSPNADKILFVTKPDSVKQIFIINIDGTERINLSNSNCDEYDPDISPDGSKIIFVSKENEFHTLNIMDSDGSDKEVVYQKNRKMSHPAFSHDGKLISFVAYKENVSRLFVMENDGSNLQEVVKGKVNLDKPQFTPDNDKIVFYSRARGMKYCDICIVRIDGKEFKNLTKDLNYINQKATITPDGESIIFQSLKSSGSEIYSISIDGENLTNLTKHSAWDQSPSI